MNLDDIIYLSLLIFSIVIGYYYRQIQDKEKQKQLGTLIGLIITAITSGFHVIHPIFFTLINCCIILLLSKKICHLVSFGFSFTYLLFFRSTLYFGIPYAPGHTNLIQMLLTLKLVGLAFEINTNYLEIQKNPDRKKEELNVGFSDIIHYAFNYIGVLTGPYYRYRTFSDYFELPYSETADWKSATVAKLKIVPIFIVLFLIGSYNWPLSYMDSEEFAQKSWLYKYWYCWPSFFIFRMRIYTGLMLSECVCTMAGFGAYPEGANAKPGEGPSENYSELRKASKQSAEKEVCNFETIHNISPYNADFCTTYRESIKHWNICIQYWLAVVVYKRFPSRAYRTTVTMLVSSYWHGVYSGYYICLGTVPLALMLEGVYLNLFLKEDPERQKISSKVYEWIHWFFRMHFLSYQGTAFLLLGVNRVLNYYNSVYHVGLVVGVVLYGFGVLLQRRKRVKQC